ncbi:MAG: Acetyltransferase domain [Solirubrobacteraceae bacterium]|nr:Acetyltransferase domain [Solirubrobacteraceae bacterium]
MAPTLSRLTLPVSALLNEAISSFDCIGEAEAGDSVAEEVRDFLKDGDYVEGIEHGYSATYLLIDPDQRPAELLGYITVSLDSIRLTDGEKKALGRPDFGDFGAVRIVMVGVDRRFVGRGYGGELVSAVVDFAGEIGEFVPVRFVVADANVRKQEWYEDRGFVVNRSKIENDPEDPSPETISMRLDLRADPD